MILNLIPCLVLALAVVGCGCAALLSTRLLYVQRMPARRIAVQHRQRGHVRVVPLKAEPLALSDSLAPSLGYEPLGDDA